MKAQQNDIETTPLNLSCSYSIPVLLIIVIHGTLTVIIFLNIFRKCKTSSGGTQFFFGGGANIGGYNNRIQGHSQV